MEADLFSARWINGIELAWIIKRAVYLTYFLPGAFIFWLN